MAEMTDLLKKSGYSSKAIEYYTKQVNLGEIENPSANFSYTGPCGDSMEIYLKIDSGTIEDAKFRTVGCPGAFASGSALTEMIKGKTLGEAEKVDENEILNHLGGIPKAKIHCARLAALTLRQTIEQYREAHEEL